MNLGTQRKLVTTVFICIGKIQYKNTTPELLDAIRKDRDELQTDLNFKEKQTTIESYECNIYFFSFYELLIYDFLWTENYKGISGKIIILLFYRVFQFFTLAQVGTRQTYYFREFINLPSINLKSFYCVYIYIYTHTHTHISHDPLTPGISEKIYNKFKPLNLINPTTHR